jgi:hypothetical protein
MSGAQRLPCAKTPKRSRPDPSPHRSPHNDDEAIASYYKRPRLEAEDEPTPPDASLRGSRAERRKSRAKQYKRSPTKKDARWASHGRSTRPAVRTRETLSSTPIDVDVTLQDLPGGKNGYNAETKNAHGGQSFTLKDIEGKDWRRIEWDGT